MAISKKNIKNLEKLANFLETEITDKQFDIGTILKNRNHNYSSRYLPAPNEIMEECGTVGCAIGWSSALFYKHALKYDDWGEFSDSLFGVNLGHPVGAYMFSDSWSEVRTQKSRKATIKRIREVIDQKGKLTPKQEGLLIKHCFFTMWEINNSRS